MATHYTYRGQAIDMGAMLLMNEHAIAIGNANMNARGDILGQGGSIAKTIEERTTEYYNLMQPVIETDEEVAYDIFVADTPVMPVEESLEDLLEGLSDAEPIEPVKPAKRKKAPTGE